MLYLYAISAWPAPPLPPVAGLGETALVAVPCADLVAVAQPLPAPPDPAEAQILAHEAVIEALMADRTVLPMRFGSTLADTAAVEAFLATRAAPFRADLTRVAGCVELSVRGISPADPADPDTAQIESSASSDRSPGRAYLEQRRVAERARLAQRAHAQAIYARLEPLARAAVFGAARHADMPLNAAYLVPREAVAAFREAVAAAGSTTPLRLLCTGPWPPYSFVTG